MLSVTKGLYRAAMRLGVVAGGLMFAGSTAARAQDNYEIQVYPSETQQPGTLLLEPHSNYTVECSTTPSYEMLPTQGGARSCRADAGDQQLVRCGFLCLHRGAEWQGCTAGGRSYLAPSAGASQLALAGWGQHLQ
jgi:hypothetical protein